MSAAENKPQGTQEFKFPDEPSTGKVDTSLETEIGGDEEEIDVQIVDDTPDRDKGRKPLETPVDDPTDEELEGYSEKVRKRIDSLTHARHDERRKAEAVERRAQELETFAQRLIEENKTLKKTHNTTQEGVAVATREKAEADLEIARRELRAAHEAFDTDAIVAAQEKLAEAKMRAEVAKSFKPTPLQETEYELQPRPTQQQSVQADPKTERWLAKNQWFGKDDEATAYAMGVHAKLVKSGVDPRSDEYYEQINARMKAKFPEIVGEPEARPTGEVRPKPATVVAPATRTTGKRTIVLTTSQQAVAKRLGLTNQQYAAQVAKLENQNG